MRMLAVFEKGERIRHIGHLDIQRSVQRGLRRSGLGNRVVQLFDSGSFHCLAGIKLQTFYDIVLKNGIQVVYLP